MDVAEASGKGPDKVRAMLEQMGSTGVRVVTVGGDELRETYNVLVSRDPIEDGDPRWHISVTGHEDVPRWRDLVAIAHRLRPGVCFVVGVPPRSWWINVHPNCLHLWETKDGNLEALWRLEAQGHRPT